MKLKSLLIGFFVFLSFQVQSANLALLITAADVASIQDDDEAAAAQWFVSAFNDGSVITTAQVETGSVDLSQYEALWIPIDRVGDGSLPAELLSTNVVNAVTAYYKGGGNLLLTSHATQYIVSLGRTARAPGILGAGAGFENGDIWGINANIGLTYDHTTHAIFSDMEVDNVSYGHPTFPLIGGGHKEDHNSMWDLNSYGYAPSAGRNVVDEFQDENDAVVLGTWQHVTDWCCAGIVEFESSGDYQGTCIAIGLAAYEWNQNSGTNDYQTNVETLTLNALNYLSPVSTGIATSDLADPVETCVYPVPASEDVTFNVESKEEFVVTIYDVTGNEIFTRAENIGELTLNVKAEGLKKGMYLYTLKSAGAKLRSGKLIVE
jgi:hypothetical protein